MLEGAIMLVRGMLPNLHPHVFIALVLVKIVLVGLLLGLEYPARARH